MDELVKLRQRVAELEKSGPLYRQVEEALQESVARYRGLTDVARDVMFTISPDGTITSLNPAFEVITGWQRTQWIGKSLKHLIHPDDLYFPIEVYQRIFSAKAPQTFELRILSKLGEYITMELAVAPQIRDGKVVGYLGTARDATESRRAGEALRESEENYRTLIDNIQDGVFLIQDEKIQFANEAFARMSGYSVEEITGRNFREFIAPEDLEMTVDRYYRRLAGEDVPKEYEIHALTRNGTKITINANVGLITYRGSAATLGTVKDITERKRAEERMLEQAALLDRVRDAVVIRDVEHRIMYWNKGAQHLYGWTGEEAMDKNADELLYKGDAPSLAQAKRSVLERGEWAGELDQTTKEGKEITVESRWALIRDSKGEPTSILTINEDITEKKRLEMQFQRAQRIESLGALAAGVAHDLNNALTPIVQSLQLLKERFTDEESQELLDVLERSAERGSEMTKQVLLFVHGVEEERKAIQVTHIIREVEKTTKETFPRSIEIRTELPEDLWNVAGDATQLNQVLMNLCVNARDAMPHGGVLRLSAQNCTIDESFTRAEAKEGPYVVITVSDTGTGIPPEVKERIFEPFFTTKEHGKGSGLGLSTSLAIVRSHGGFIDIESEAGKGATFRVYLPAVRPEAQKTEAQVPHRGSVLVVDAEARVSEDTKAALEAHGYRVHAARDGAEAVSLYSQYREEIKVILIDTVTNGAASVWVLRKINPNIKVIAISGSTGSGEPADAADAILTKPYTAEKLLETVSEVLGAK